MFEDKIQSFLLGGDYLDFLPSLAGDGYYFIIATVAAVAFVILGVIVAHFQALRNRVGAGNSKSLWVSLVVALVSVIVIVGVLLPFPHLFEREYTGTPDTSCSVYVKGDDGKPVLGFAPIFDPNTNKMVMDGNVPKTRTVPVKWDYYVPLQDLKPTPNNHLQIKVMQDDLYNQSYHLCSFDLTKPENRQMSQRLQERMEKMKALDALKKMQAMQQDPKKMEELAKELGKQGEAGKEKLAAAQEMLKKLEEMREAEAAKQGTEGKKGQGGQPGDGLKMQLPSSSDDMKWLKDENVKTSKEEENQTEGPNRKWKETTGENPFKPDDSLENQK